MNKAIITGIITRKPDVRYNDNGMAIARFTVALDRGGKDKGADYPSCVAFGKTAEFIEKYFDKGSAIGVDGHISTGSYEKNGQKVYTTDIIADRVEFINGGRKNDERRNQSLSGASQKSRGSEISPDEFEPLATEDLPF